MKKYLTAFLFITLFIVITNFAFSATIYVKHDASGSNNGLSWANAFTSFQSALNNANSGDQIWVAAGTYKPTSDYGLGGGPRFNHFRMINNVGIYGGFAGTETLLSQRNISNNVTTLSGDIGTIGDNTDNCYHVFFHPSGLGLTSSAVLDGFTIRDGNANGSAEHSRGGGIHNNLSSPNLNNLIIKNNVSTHNGGGLYNLGSAPNVTNCIIEYNTAVNGGGLFNGGTSSPSLINVYIRHNSATFGGGGVYNITNSSPTLINSLIANNSASGNGGGIENSSSSSVTLVNVTIVNNTATNGGGIFCISTATSVIRNSIIWDNNAPSQGHQIYTDGCEINLFYSNYKNTIDDVEIKNTGEVNPDANTIFVDPNFVDSENEDYSLFSSSASVNTGNNSFNLVSTDLRGQQRIQNTTIDMGAYEWTSGLDPLGIIYVSDSRPDDAGSGSSWATAKKSLQAALGIAVSGSQIWVAAGTYKPTTGTDRGISFSMISGVEIYGGFAGTEASNFDIDDRDIATNETILSGDIGTQGDNSDNTNYIIRNNNVDNTAIIDGFTITKGNANSGSGSVQLGGAINNTNSSPKIKNCKFIENSAGFHGGAVHNASSSPLFVNCLFFSNTSGESGGAFRSQVGNPLLINCTFVNNNSNRGGAISNNFSSTNTTIVNSIIWGNTANEFNQIWNNQSSTTTITYSIVEGGHSGTANINLDPQFANSALNDFRLFSASPAVNSGNNTYNTEATDIRGKQRIQNTTIDRGAYEWTSGVDPQSPCTNPTSGGTIAAAQTICNNTAPAAFTNSAFPTGHSGTLEYKWQSSTTSAAAGFIDIASSNSATYTSGALTATTWFKRLARVSCSADWSGAAESNVIRVAILPTTVYVSSSYSSSTEGWGVSHFADVDDVLDLACTGITVNISDYTHTGNFNISGHTLILGNGDFVHNGTLSGGLIRTTGTGRLMQTAVQNTSCTFPVTDGTNNFTVTITPTSESTSGMIGVKLNTGKDEDGALKSPMTFFDIYGDEDLDATVFLRIDKAAISPATMEANTIMRFWNGERYQPIPTDRVTISDQVDCYIITITGMNYFNNVIPD